MPDPLKPQTGTADATSDPARQAKLEPLLAEVEAQRRELELQNHRLRHVQTALETSRDRYRALYDFSPVGLLTLSKHGGVLEANVTCARLLGVGDVAGKSLVSFVAPIDIERYYRFLARLEACTVRATCDLWLRRANGDVFAARLDCLRSAHDAFNDPYQLSMSDVSMHLELERVRVENGELRDKMSRHMVTVQEEARRRLAAELHDRTSPNLAAIAINLDIISTGLPVDHSVDVAERLEDTRSLIDDTASSVREICADLRPPVLDYAGLYPAIDGYAKQMARRTGIAIRFDGPSEGRRLQPHVESLLFRIAQEALTNCVKHANASTIMIGLDLADDAEELSIADDGQGFDVDTLKDRESVGHGVLNMRAMAEFAGGAFSISATPGGGTRVRVRMGSGE